MIQFQKFVDDVAYPTYSEILSRLPDHSMNKTLQADYIERVKDASIAASSFIANKIFPRLRYISARELLQSVIELSDLLNQHRADSNKKLALVVVNAISDLSKFVRIWEKSNIMMTILVAHHLKPDAVYVKHCFYSENMIDASANKDYEYLLVDDCMYSGNQMKINYNLLQKSAWAGKTYSVVPFVHNVRLFADILHPKIHDFVFDKSSTLQTLSEDDKARATRLGLKIEGTALTYLQTKMPDSVSVTYWMIHGGNPFRSSTYEHVAYRENKLSFSLINGCADKVSCPDAKYKEIQASFGNCASKHFGGARKRTRRSRTPARRSCRSSTGISNTRARSKSARSRGRCRRR